LLNVKISANTKYSLNRSASRLNDSFSSSSLINKFFSAQ
jgi:hypothetical protein